MTSKYLLFMVLPCLLSGCFGTVIQLRTTKVKEVDIISYRRVVSDIHVHVMKSGHSSGCEVRAHKTQDIHNYEISDNSDADQLRAVIRYIVNKNQKQHPGVFELIHVKKMSRSEANESIRK